MVVAQIVDWKGGPVLIAVQAVILSAKTVSGDAMRKTRDMLSVEALMVPRFEDYRVATG